MGIPKKLPLLLLPPIDGIQLLTSGDKYLPLRAAVHLRPRPSSCQTDSGAWSALEVQSFNFLNGEQA
jgi:hypothetical protein